MITFVKLGLKIIYHTYNAKLFLIIAAFAYCKTSNTAFVLLVLRVLKDLAYGKNQAPYVQY